MLTGSGTFRSIIVNGFGAAAAVLCFPAWAWPQDVDLRKAAEGHAAAMVLREVEANRAAQAKIFDRLKAMPGGAPANPARLPAAPAGGVRAGVVPVPMEEIEDPIVIEDRIEDDLAGRPSQTPVPLVPEEAFDRWIYFGGTKGPSTRVLLERMLQQRIREFEQVFILTPIQKKKLMLAGQGDIKRLLDEVEDHRREFQAARYDVDQLQRVVKDLQALRVSIALGPFGFDSLYAKSIKKMTDEGQLERRRTGERRS